MKKFFLAWILCIAFLSGCSASNSTIAVSDPALQEPIILTSAESENTVPANSSFEIHFIDVGQADSALILCDNEAMLIDGGNVEDSSLIYAYLESHGIKHLDVAIGTHPHEDHIGGLSGCLSYASVDTAYCSVTSYDSRAFDNFTSQLDKQGVEITVPSPGDTFSIGTATATILGPISSSDEPNNTSIVVRIDYGNTSFLFTGDAETEEENEILDAGYDVSCDVLKVGHHGSNTSTGYRWLREADPEYAVISVGQGNDYGHPTEDTLSKLRDADVTVYRTDMQGHIICTSDGETISFSVERNADADTLSGAGAGGHHVVETEPQQEETPSSSDGTVTYVVNTNTGKFHEPNCGSVDDMSAISKLEVSSTREELVGQGYSPCGRCKP